MFRSNSYAMQSDRGQDTQSERPHLFFRDLVAFVAPLCLDIVLLWQNGDCCDVSGSGGGSDDNGAISGVGDVGGSGDICGEVGSNLPINAYLRYSEQILYIYIYICT